MNGPFRQLVLRRLGFESQPPRDLDGLRAIYQAWCTNVPFDSVRKMIALRTTPDLPLPGGHDWLVDSSLLANVPLLLDQGVFIHNNPVFGAEVEAEDSTHLVWSHTPPNSAWLFCRLSRDDAPHAAYLARHEESRARSPFNQRLDARRNRPGEMVVLRGNTRFSKTAEGVASRDLSPDQVCDALRRDTANPPPVTRKLPSQR